MRFATFVLVAQLALAATLHAADDVLPRLTHLDLDVAVNYEDSALTGSATYSIRNDSGTAIASIPFILNRLMTFGEATDDTGARLSLRQSVVRFEDEAMLQVNAGVVRLTKPLQPRASTVVTVKWSGNLVGYTETGALYIRDTIAPEFTILRADAYAFPEIGVTSVRAMRAAPASSFSFTAAVETPRDEVVATGGKLLSATINGSRKRTSFSSGTSTVPFLNIAIAPYGTVSGGGVTVYYLPGDENGARSALDRAQKCVALFTSWFGPLDAPPNLTVIEIPDGWGSQADLNAGIIQTAAAFHDSARLEELYHEISHIWNAPDSEMPSPRWNEGWGRYIQRVAAEVLDERPMSATEADELVRALQTRAESQPRLGEVPLVRYGAERLTDYSYRVGGMYFQILERLIGREQLLSRYREYFQQHKQSGGSTAQLFAVLRAGGGRSVESLTRDFITSAAWLEAVRQAPTFDALVQHYRDVMR